MVIIAKITALGKAGRIKKWLAKAAWPQNIFPVKPGRGIAPQPGPYGRTVPQRKAADTSAQAGQKTARGKRQAREGNGEWKERTAANRVVLPLSRGRTSGQAGSANAASLAKGNTQNLHCAAQ
ncbi:hypothetical protein [Desulfovibrio falkowii]|uniref:hypothetical protein n=1 Tax=Desulfovibrio sp. WGS1351 TaxID=3366814 RepID=UPI0025F5A625|nr:hypothetical protein [uncultured Desulfovibrio sp.]